MKNFLTISVLLVAPLVFLWGCDNDTTNGGITDGGGVSTGMTCIGCHSSRDMLEEALGKVSGPKIFIGNKDDG